MTKQCKSEALAAAHEAVLGLAEAGLVSEYTMREFDEMCLEPDKGPVKGMASDEIRVPRLRQDAS